MAIVFRAAATANATAVTSITCNKPAGTVDNDVMVATIITDNGTVITAPSGWTQKISTTGNVQQETYTKVAASEGANYTWSWSLVLRDAVVVILTYNPNGVTVTITAAGQDNASSTNIVAPSINIPAANSILVNSYGISGSVTITLPGGQTLRGTDQSTGVGPYTLKLGDEARGSGATGTRTATASAAGGNSGHAIGLSPPYDGSDSFFQSFFEYPRNAFMEAAKRIYEKIFAEPTGAFFINDPSSFLPANSSSVGNFLFPLNSFHWRAIRRLEPEYDVVGNISSPAGPESPVSFLAQHEFPFAAFRVNRRLVPSQVDSPGMFPIPYEGLTQPYMVSTYPGAHFWWQSIHRLEPVHFYSFSELQQGLIESSWIIYQNFLRHNLPPSSRQAIAGSSGSSPNVILPPNIPSDLMITSVFSNPIPNQRLTPMGFSTAEPNVQAISTIVPMQILDQLATPFPALYFRPKLEVPLFVGGWLDEPNRHTWHVPTVQTPNRFQWPVQGTQANIAINQEIMPQVFRFDLEQEVFYHPAGNLKTGSEQTGPVMLPIDVLPPSWMMTFPNPRFPVPQPYVNPSLQGEYFATLRAEVLLPAWSQPSVGLPIPLSTWPRGQTGGQQPGQVLIQTDAETYHGWNVDTNQPPPWRLVRPRSMAQFYVDVPYYESGTVFIVGPPYYTVQGQIYVAGAVQGDVASEG